MPMRRTRRFVSEKERLQTFQSWPLSHSATPYEFVQAGFYYSGEQDKVICSFCDGELSNWGPKDNPMEKHRINYPDCLFVKENMRPIHSGASPFVNNTSEYRSPTINPASFHRSTETQQSTVETNSKHIYLHPMDKPSCTPPATRHDDVYTDPMDKPCCTSQATRHNVYTDYTKEHNRLNSFTNWSSRNQTPQELARAGFYYTGIGDRVQCFACKGIVKFWQVDDDPWIEHAKFFPNCPYLKLCMGEGLTDAIHEESARMYPKEYIDSYDEVDVCG
ncbi:hypothetical protein SNE40_015420 [Patella caerulea]|uniref:Uncharacterized protein n=1 Tax=Patella caerulea TaxID=87958 RepID=A0AAN8JNG6_PATCE